MFGAIAGDMIDPAGIRFRPALEDVEALNRKAVQGVYDVTKMSVSAYAFAADTYVMLGSGHALGYGCGPLLVARQHQDMKSIAKLRIAIPGRHTTANLLMGTFFPEAGHKTEMLFSDIEDAVLSGAFDAGVLIHESRFTYADRGLHKLADLGRLWEERTGMPVPLGCIAAKRSLGPELIRRIDNALHDSIRYAMDHPDDLMPYVREHAAELDDTVIRQHIGLYVNDHSLALDTGARRAITGLLAHGHAQGLLPDATPFIEIPDRTIKTTR